MVSILEGRLFLSMAPQYVKNRMQHKCTSRDTVKLIFMFLVLIVQHFENNSTT